MRYLHSFISFLFFVFAIVQWNDPDPYLWVALYMLMSVVPFLYQKAKLNKYFIGALSIGLAILTTTYLPDLITWLNDGMPDVTTSMKAETPYIEIVREALGLLLCLIVSVVYWMKVRSK